METVVLALASISLAAALERAILSRRVTKLRAVEQAFQFHALRDELQLLVADGRVAPTSLTYDFLMHTVNFAIRNAGVVKLRDCLELAQRIQKKVDQTHFERILADIKKHDSAVQELAGKCFSTFANMLISNDWIVSAGVLVAKRIQTSWDVLRPFLALLHRGASAFFGLVTPIRLEAVHHARQYNEWANRLSPC